MLYRLKWLSSFDTHKIIYCHAENMEYAFCDYLLVVLFICKMHRVV